MVQTQNSNLSEWAKSFAIKFNKGIDEQNKIEYKEWQEHLSKLKSTFEEAAELVSTFGRYNKVEVKDLSILDCQKYIDIKDRAKKVEQTGYFQLIFNYGTQFDRYLFYFGHSSPQLSIKNTTHSLFISREEPGITNQTFVKLDKISTRVPHIREIAFCLQDKQFYVRSKDQEYENVFSYSKDQITKSLFDDILNIHF